MNAIKRIPGIAGSMLAVLCFSSCGVEGLVNSGFTDANELEVVTVSGTFTNSATSVSVINADGVTVEALETRISGQSFEIDLDLDGPLENVVVVAAEGDKVVQSYEPLVPGEGSLVNVDLSPVTTAAYLILTGAMADQDRDRKTLDPEVATVALVDAAAELATTEGAMFLSWVEQALEVADGSAATSTTGPFNFSGTGNRIRGAWWDANGSDTRLMFGLSDFNGVVVDTAAQLNVIGCVDPNLIRVIFEADLTQTRVDGRCRVTNGFAFGTKDFVQPDDGDKMFFTGSLNEDSPVPTSSDERIVTDNLLGAFDPNAIPMFDDGTNGDEVAGDNIWTVAFTLPRGAYVQYKYTWGKQGEPWTGTEEWPGNERLLEIVDVNGDDFVRRRDAFGDESTNKSVANECCGIPQPPRLPFDPPTDLTSNGFAETQEQPLDGPPVAVERQYDCAVTADDWVVPAGIGPVLIDCSEL